METLEEAVDRRVAELAASGVPRRIWEHDHTVWRPDPREIEDRLGWLTLPGDMRSEVADLRGFSDRCRADGLSTAVLLGMGGSSLAPEVFGQAFGRGGDGMQLIVLDSTHPDQILDVERALDLSATMFLVASKSGTTVETLSHLAYFWDRLPEGSHFAAITDPGTPLAELAEEREFRRVFLADPTVGGRYSALSHFGLVPAAFAGAEIEELLDSAGRVAAACGPNVAAEDNLAVRLGATMAEAALMGRDKLTLVAPQAAPTFGSWLEQLVAESTGKDGKGIVPVQADALGPPGVYGEDRLFVSLGSGPGEPILRWLERAGHAVVRLTLETHRDLGGEMFRWEFAVAVAGAVLGVHPFDQPNVQSAKDATRAILQAGVTPDVDAMDVQEVLAGADPGSYVAIQAFLPRRAAVEERLRIVRAKLRDRLRVAPTFGFGPRYLHSTGQLHKGGPPRGHFIQVVEPLEEDAPIPGEPYTFGRLIEAQAAGDLAALRELGRPVARATLGRLEAVASS